MNLRGTYLELFRHSSVYALGGILGRFASIVLLPIYTRYVRPADYASIAILDLTTGILTALIGSGMGAALTRHHFDDEREEYRRCLWWTGVGFITATATIIVVPTWLARGTLADFLLGPEVHDRVLYLSVALPQLWTGTIGQIPETHLRARKQSTLYVTLSLGRLLVNVGLNLLFLIRFGMGATGVLLGNLLTSALYTAVQITILSVSLGAPRLDRRLLAALWRYGSPLIATALLATLMHNGDRYILRFFVDMKAIGIYSLAYVFGQGINTMLLTPFAAIWNVTVYEVAAAADPEKIFVAVFRHFFHAMLLVMFTVSLVARPLLELLVAPDYRPAADLIPVVCLAYVFFSLHDQFRLPVILHKRTSLLPPVFLFATLLNIFSNLVLIPFLGIAGAAWASVITFAGFSAFGLWRYRTVARYPYPLAICGGELLAMAACYMAYRAWIAHFRLGLVAQVLGAAVLSAGWMTVFFGKAAAAFFGGLPARGRPASA